jgi:hypothetical protein
MVSVALVVVLLNLGETLTEAGVVLVCVIVLDIAVGILRDRLGLHSTYVI